MVNPRMTHYTEFAELNLPNPSCGQEKTRQPCGRAGFDLIGAPDTMSLGTGARLYRWHERLLYGYDL